MRLLTRRRNVPPPAADHRQTAASHGREPELPARMVAAMAGPVIVGVEGSDRSRDALALGRRLANGLGVDLVTAYVHPYAELAGLLAGGPAGEALQLIDELAESAHASVRRLTDELNIEDLRLTSASSAAAGLQALAEETGAGLVALGSSRARASSGCCPVAVPSGCCPAARQP